MQVGCPARYGFTSSAGLFAGLHGDTSYSLGEEATDAAVEQQPDWDETTRRGIHCHAGSTEVQPLSTGQGHEQMQFGWGRV